MEFGAYGKNQHNVLVLVGNGFDIQALGDLGVRGDTRYESFYYFLKSRNFNEANCIFRVMEDCKNNNYKNWSDVEGAIQQLVDGRYDCCKKENGEVNFDKLSQDLSEIQSEFSEFLNQVVTPKVLNDLSKLAQGNDKDERGKLLAGGRELLEDDYKRKCYLVIHYLKELLECKKSNEEKWLEQLDPLLEGFKLPERDKWQCKVLGAKKDRATKKELLKVLKAWLPYAGDSKWDWGLNILQEKFCDRSSLHPLLYDLLSDAGDYKWDPLQEKFCDRSSLHPLLYDLKDALWREGYMRYRMSEELEELLWGVDNRKPLALISFQNFLQDLSEKEYGQAKMKKKEEVNHHHLFNFHFINFNYTFLFDNYIYLDQEQFKPKRYGSSGNNFTFHTDFYHTRQMRLVTHAPIHPHGIQTIPRSILFGIDAEYYDDEKKKKFAKPYWAQNEDKYSPLIEGADYFIIFGTSLGETDRWWWKSIINRIENAKKDKKHVEVFLYWYKKKSDERRNKVLKHFATVAGYEEDECVMELLKNHVRVIFYNDETKERVWLNTNPQKVPVWGDRKQDWKER